MRRVEPLLRLQRAMQVTARVTVTPSNLALKRTLDEFVAAGFHSVAFSPMLSALGAQGEMHADHLERMLGEMIDCGREYERCVRLGRRYPFANMVNAMREIHCGTHRPYPCGAGAGYLGVSADGELAACHRFVGDLDGAMARSLKAWTGSAGGIGSRPGTFTGRSLAGPAGPAISAAAAAITRFCGAAGLPATMFAAGCTIASKPIEACAGARGVGARSGRGPWLRSASSAPARRARSLPPAWLGSGTRSA